jgi:predicted aspartyl protease
MIGRVDDYGRALISITVRHPSTNVVATWDAWVDTACSAELVIPLGLISALGLTCSGNVKAGLGDGTVVFLDTYSCIIDWSGNRKPIEAVANEGRIPLIGVGLLAEFELVVDYPGRTVTVQESRHSA